MTWVPVKRKRETRLFETYSTDLFEADLLLEMRSCNCFKLFKFLPFDIFFSFDDAVFENILAIFFIKGSVFDRNIQPLFFVGIFVVVIVVVVVGLHLNGLIKKKKKQKAQTKKVFNFNKNRNLVIRR